MTACPHLWRLGLRGDRCQLLHASASPAATLPPCEACRSQWIDGRPPTSAEPPAILVQLGAAPRDPSASSLNAPRPTPHAPRRTKCDHLGAVVDRHECPCHRQWTRRCELLDQFVQIDGVCRTCEHWEPENNE